MARQIQPKSNPKTEKADPSGRRLVAIRACDGDKNERIEEFILGSSAPIIVRMAREWGYIVRVRTRWAGDTDMRDHFAEKAVKDLGRMGIATDVLQRLTSVQHIEVELYDPAPKRNVPKTSVTKTTTTTKTTAPADDPADDLDAAAEIPWEYLLSAATLFLGRTEALLVTRCLSNGAAIPSSKTSRPRQVLVVESAPGRIDAEYGFDDEETRLTAAMNLEEGKGLKFARTEPYSKLQETLRKEAWEVIHVTGVDTHQAAWLIQDFYDKVDEKLKAKVIDKRDHLHDGMILRGEQKSELPVRYDELADLLLESRTRPRIVTLNLYYSGARTARELVRRGAHAALGFLDEIDDEFAELFFQAFYWAWCHKNLSIAEAFLDAWSNMDGDRMHGTGIVIWLGRSFVAPSNTSRTRAAPSKQARKRGN